MKKKLCFSLALLMVLIPAVTACNSSTSSSNEVKTQVIDQKATEPVKTNTDGTNTALSTDEVVQGIMDKMTLEEKVGQVFIMSLRNLPKSKTVLEVNKDVVNLINNYHLGGIILFSENINTPNQTKKLINDMQSQSKIGLFIAVDEEGGIVSRITASPKMHATVLPNNAIIGSTNNVEMATKAARVIGEEISSLGFNMDFAPVADTNTNPNNPVIGKRSFGSDPQLVSEMVQAEVKEFSRQNIIPVLKHFPGHGDTSQDTHTGAVVINHDIDRLNKVEFVPFEGGIEAGAEGIMIAHIQVPKVTNTDLPATLSKEIMTDILRNQMNYKGLIITDALEMGAISNYWTPGEAAVRAFEAGADILLMPSDISAAYKGLLDAVKNHQISEERLNESVKRILLTKLSKKILEKSVNDSDPETILGSEEHLKIAEEIRNQAK